MSYTREQGIQAIIDLQASIGITESKEKATAGWDNLSPSERRSTEQAHEVVCGGFKKESEKDA